MLRTFFSNCLELEDMNSLKRQLCRFGPYLTLSVSYGPNQGFDLAVPVLCT